MQYNASSATHRTHCQPPQVPSLMIGELLIRCMYQAQPQLELCSQAQLLQLVTLADSLDASTVTEAASRQLQLIAADPEAELQWETAMQIYNLPAACPDMAAYKPLYAAAAKRVFADLGDLEVVCQSTDQLWPKLLQLPHLALLQLLSNRLTRAAREDTVAYVIQQWAQAQPQQPTLQQMQRLCDGKVLRLGYCSPLYLATVIGGWPLLAQCFTPQQLSCASVFANSYRVGRTLDRQPDSPVSRAVVHELRSMCIVLRGNVSVAGKREFSQLKAENVERRHAYSLRELEAVVQSALRHAADGGEQAPCAVAAHFPAFAGRTYTVHLRAVTSSSEAAAADEAAAGEAAVDEAAAAEAAAAARQDGEGAGAPAALMGLGAPAAGVSCTLQMSLTFGNDMPQVCIGFHGEQHYRCFSCSTMVLYVVRRP
jgi:hypothetical protein